MISTWINREKLGGGKISASAAYNVALENFLPMTVFDQISATSYRSGPEEQVNLLLL